MMDKDCKGFSSTTILAVALALLKHVGVADVRCVCAHRFDGDARCANLNRPAGPLAFLMLRVSPLGIPCSYFVLVWRSRHKLDPDPLFVASDVACDGRLTNDSVPITDEMRQLTTKIVLIHGTAADIVKKAIGCFPSVVSLPW